jgi:hypothetical protein
MRALGRLILLVLGLGAVAAVAYGLYSGATWIGYGRERREAIPVSAAAMVSLDRFMPTYDVSERHETGVRAPMTLTYAAARDLDLQRSGLVRAILKSRKLIMRDEGEEMDRRPFLEQVHAMGWGLLQEVPGRAMVFGAVTKPWESEVRFHPLPPAKFAAFRSPGWAKIIWTLEVDPATRDRSVFRTRTRVATTDATARKRFRSYWSKVKPGVMLIRQQALGLVKSDAEKRARAIARVEE